MKQKDYHKSITTDVSPKEAFEKIGRVDKWWTKNFKGSTKNLNDVFTLQFGESTFTFRVEELIPTQKIVWLVTDCYMPWLNDKTEWTNTKIVFEIFESTTQTTIDFTHVGLVPEVECYSVCEVGWDQYFGESIPNLLATGIGILFDD